MGRSHGPDRVPTLTDGIVTLREHRPDDVPAIVSHARDPLMRRWTTVPSPYGAQDAEQFVTDLDARWADTGLGGWAVEVEGRYAGSIELRPETAGAAAGIGFSLSSWARGRGLMRRAVNLATGWGFERRELDAVLWRALVGNWPSRRVAWACGFRVEGRVRGLLPQHGAAVDGWIGSLRRGDPAVPAQPWLEVPRLAARGVVLRAFRETDAARVVEAALDPVTRHWLGALPGPYGRPEAMADLERHRDAAASGRAVAWAVADARTDRFLGEVAIHVRRPERLGEIGYWTHPDARGRGVATTAAALAARHALLPVEDGGLGLPRLLLRAAEGNAASRRVAEKVGFVRTGVDRASDVLGDGTVVDHVRHDLLPGELGRPL